MILAMRSDLSIEDLYLSDVREWTVPTPTEERDLLVRYKAATGAERERLRNEIVCRNQRLVISIVQRNQGKGLPLLDLISEGNIGFIHALELFDLSRDTRLSTYATNWIEQFIQRAIRDKSSNIRKPNFLFDRRRDVTRADAALQDSLGRMPTHAEIAEFVGCTEAGVLAALSIGVAEVSIDRMGPSDSDGEYKGADCLADRSTPSMDDILERQELLQALDWGVSQLTQREKQVVGERHGFNAQGKPKTLEEIGQTLDITRERVRQIQVIGVKKLQEALREAGLTGLAD